MRTKRNRAHELLNACYFGNKNMALRLLREGADPNYTDPRDGWAGIHYAARWGQMVVVHGLIRAGANVNLLTRDRESPLHIACSTNRTDICVYLMRNGANPGIMNLSQQRPTDMTADTKIKFVCNHFEEYRKIMAAEKEQQQKKIV